MANSSGNSRQTLLFMVGVALALRLTVMAFVYPERLNPTRDYWRYGGEAARIARSIVEGKGFSNPCFADTGPTAWTLFLSSLPQISSPRAFALQEKILA